jgi:hypothetical protein
MIDFSRILSTVLLLACSFSANSSGSLHLLGFVEKPCVGENYCFQLRVEAVYSGEAADEIILRYDADSMIFDPENYRLTLLQSRIVEGSHLRLLLVPAETGFRAEIIWIGD